MKSKFNSRHVRKVLNESLSNPTEKAGPLRIIVEQNNPDFYEIRAMEFVIEARQVLTGVVTNLVREIYADKIGKAISLLALAKLIRLHLNDKKDQE